MRRFSSAALLGLSMILVTACASNVRPLDADANVDTDGQIEFIDLDTFDMTLSRDLQRQTDLVVIRFPNQPITINQMPDRLQKWLSAVHQHGQGLTVESKEGYVQKDIISLVGLVMSGYKVLKQNMPAILGRKYKAVITLENADGGIEKIEFVRF